MSMTQDDANPGGLSEMLGQCLNKCIERGMQFPFMMVAIAINGSIYGLRITRRDGAENDIEVIIDHVINGGFVLPINIMVVDAYGEATRILLSKDGSLTFH